MLQIVDTLIFVVCVLPGLAIAHRAIGTDQRLLATAGMSAALILLAGLLSRLLLGEPPWQLSGEVTQALLQVGGIVLAIYLVMRPSAARAIGYGLATYLVAITLFIGIAVARSALASP